MSSIGNPILVPEGYFPDDLDTTSLALMVLQPEKEVVTSMLDEMLEYVHPDGKFQVSDMGANSLICIARLRESLEESSLNAYLADILRPFKATNR